MGKTFARHVECGTPPLLSALLRLLRLIFHIFEPAIRVLAWAGVGRCLKELLMLTECGMDLTYGLGIWLSNKIRAGCMAHGVQVRLGAPLTGLILGPGGTVAGAQVGGDGGGGEGRKGIPPGTKRIRVVRGIVLACGGFSHNPSLRRQLAGPVLGTGAAAGNTGDAHVLLAKARSPVT